MPTKNKIKIKKNTKENRKTKKIKQSYDWIIAIASHEREKLIEEKTLRLLTKHKIPMTNVYVFVSEKSHIKYKPLVEKYKLNLVKSKNSIMDTRNHVINYFPSDKKIVEMDDDIVNLFKLEYPKPRAPIKNLSTFITNSFKKLKENKGLWGVNATDDNRKESVSSKDKFGAYSIINSFCGYFNNKKIKLTVPEKEDFDRTAQFIKLKLPVLKQSMYGIRSNYWKNKGGIQAHYSFKKRLSVQKKSAELLVKKFPDYFIKHVRDNGIVDIRFRKTNL